MTTSETKPGISEADGGSRKRLLRALRRQPVDRPPFWFMRQAGRYLPEYRSARADAGSFLELCYKPELATEVTLQPLRRYRMDAAILFADILLVPDALGQPVEYREGEGPVLRPVRSAGELAKLSLDRLQDRLAPVYETVRRLSRSLAPDVALIGFAGAPWTVATYMVEGGGSKDHAIAKRWAFSDPEGFQDLIDLLIEATVDYLANQVRAGAEVVQLFDSWAGVLPEPAFRRWCLEPARTIARRLLEAFPDLPVIGFPRGAGAMYEAYAREAGLAGVGIDPTVPVGWARDRLQGLVTVQGNLDPQLLVTGGAAMRDAALAILETLGSGPFIFNLGHGVVPETPPEHVAELSELLRNWRGAGR